MNWILILIIILLSLLMLIFIRLPVAFAFLAINIVFTFLLWNGQQGLMLFVASIKDSLAQFSLVPIPLFILMGELMFHTGIATKLINTLDKWFGKIPGRLSLLAVGAGTMLSTLTASTMATTAMLGSTLLPEMREKDYDKSISMGPILASGGLAIMIPPSALGVLLASLGKISVGDFLIAIIIPGLLMALSFFVYIVIVTLIRPNIAPQYSLEQPSLKEKITDTIKYILPLSLIIFLVIGSIFLGIASPTESAAMGAFGSLILAFAYRKMTLEVLVKAVKSTLELTTMILMIVAGSAIFGQILSFSGVTRNLVNVVNNIEYSSIVIILVMLLIVLFMGTFMESLSIMMIVVPMYIPIVEALNADTLWFAVLLLIAIEVGQITPPFGMGLFVMKGVAPKDINMKDIYISAVPYIVIIIALILVLVMVPGLVTWLPNIMRT